MKYKYFDFLTSYRIPPDDLYTIQPRPIDDYQYLTKNTKWSNLEDAQSAANNFANNCNVIIIHKIQLMMFYHN